MKSDSLIRKLMMLLFRKLRVTCKDTTPLISELMDHNLPLGKRIRLKFHLAMCQVCGFYQKQLQVIQALARKLGKEEASTQQQAVLSGPAKAKLKESLNQSS
ncbi:MAG: zf-HC2 domain-containing protein [Nitrospinota bacterium]|nr:zf-HC2 domain-containing protein [Nitrospinota bacterium]